MRHENNSNILNIYDAGCAGRAGINRNSPGTPVGGPDTFYRTFRSFFLPAYSCGPAGWNSFGRNGLGFGMNLYSAVESGKDGMLFTIVSVVGVMVIGTLLGRVFRLSRNNSYLISSGTAICGGSAIAAVAPIIDADDNETTMSMVTVFVLNAVALLIFPAIGHLLGLSQEQFGTWAAIAIHDTSSVVGAGAAYGEEALQIATTVKLTRALWIIPMAIATTFIFRKKGKKISIPWFIFLFIAAMLANTYLGIPEKVSAAIAGGAKHALGATLFLIGCGLSLQSVKKTGVRPFLLGISLWAVISLSSLAVVMMM